VPHKGLAYGNKSWTAYAGAGGVACPTTGPPDLVFGCLTHEVVPPASKIIKHSVKGRGLKTFAGQR
ncbi:MAG: hypothetical protein ACREDQ_09330, partial [Limisphaerales bacterium]